MERLCDVCGAQYVAKRRTSRYCSPRCRMRARRGSIVPTLTKLHQGLAEPPAALVEAVTVELEAAGRLNSSLGQQAILLAGRIGAPVRHRQLDRRSVKGAPRSHGQGFGGCAARRRPARSIAGSTTEQAWRGVIENSCAWRACLSQNR
jgi:hypothetical protein